MENRVYLLLRYMRKVYVSVINSTVIQLITVNEQAGDRFMSSARAIQRYFDENVNLTGLASTSTFHESAVFNSANKSASTEAFQNS